MSLYKSILEIVIVMAAGALFIFLSFIYVMWMAVWVIKFLGI